MPLATTRSCSCKAAEKLVQVDTEGWLYPQILDWGLQHRASGPLHLQNMEGRKVPLGTDPKVGKTGHKQPLNPTPVSNYLMHY